MRLVLLSFIFLFFLSTGSTLRTFKTGRSRHFSLGTPIIPNNAVLPEEQWFTQFLDHFNPVEGRTWQQRYFVNATFYKSGGPAFLMIGGEGTASPKWMLEGQWIEYAKQFGALCFQLEHRFYGKSHPTFDTSIKNLAYLSSEQALADLAYFIEGMNESFKLSNGTKWIVFGGSYPGSLAAWMRLKYPHLVHGAVSSSGPLLAQIDFQQYYIVVENALKSYSEKCVEALLNAHKQFHAMLRHRVGQEGLAKKFNLCDPIDPGHTKKIDISNLYESIASIFAGIIQYNHDNRNNSASANYTVESVCDTMINETIGIAIDRLAEISNNILKANKEKCLDYRYDKMIREMRNVSWTSEDDAEGGRQWIYQTCTEFGFFQTSTARPQLFSETFPVDFFAQQCIDIFGPRYGMHLLESAVKRTNTMYGALDIELTNVVFVHGSIDPWHALGITKSSNPNAPAIFIEGTAHCANMYPPSKNDPPQLQKARVQVGQYIDQWLKN
ncbi:putative serine protease F56F10.1 [Prorops nasuta]|uniref:putative serine protease F56F10.1 n=1 Tax=Prorops nasuta TaxID=863751 RepID=UPI0034CD52AB